MHQLLVLRVVALRKDLLTRPMAPKPQLSCIGSLTWYGVAINTLEGFHLSHFDRYTKGIPLSVDKRRGFTFRLLFGLTSRFIDPTSFTQVGRETIMDECTL